MLRIALCDDQPEVMDELYAVIHAYIPTAVITKHISLFSLSKYVTEVQKGNVDIIFLDISFQEGNGILEAARLQKLFLNIRIVFITGYVQYAQDIFEVNPTYFLVKPLQKKSILQALEKAVGEVETSRKSCIIINVKGNIHRIMIRDIYYVESERRKIFIHGNGDSIESYYMKLDDFISKAPGVFLRCHQSFAVNMDKICYFSSKHVILFNGKKLLVSQRKYREAKEQFFEYIQGNTYL